MTGFVSLIIHLNFIILFFFNLFSPVSMSDLRQIGLFLLDLCIDSDWSVWLKWMQFVFQLSDCADWWHILQFFILWMWIWTWIYIYIYLFFITIIIYHRFLDRNRIWIQWPRRITIILTSVIILIVLNKLVVCWVRIWVNIWVSFNSVQIYFVLFWIWIWILISLIKIKKYLLLLVWINII